MELVERYLAAIARELPEAQRADITAELRDLLLSQIEEKEGELGRPLGRDETEGLLKAFGHPLAVAFRYRRYQRLIGPEVFPFYLRALKVFLMLGVTLHVIVMAVRLARGVDPARAVIGLVDQLFVGLVWIVGAVTLVFVLIDHAPGAKPFDRWRPRDLPPPYLKRSKGLFDILFDTVVDIVFIAWWTGAVSFPYAWTGAAGPLEVALAPVWDRFYWPVLAVPLASLAANLLVVVRPGWTRITAGAEAAAAAYAALLAIVLLGAGPWVTVDSETLGTAAVAWRSAVLNTVMFWLLAGIGVVHALEAAWAARRLFGPQGRPGLGAPAL
ncbi:hypothetical protein ACFODL_16925 [Phenylobacterium terrae]|uniref:Uncharacterized protein n=1 Tax=Phenylobacterium terrae TaxID=2665495 RepID=A0ABW4N317_9CAUL